MQYYIVECLNLIGQMMRLNIVKRDGSEGGSVWLMLMHLFL